MANNTVFLIGALARDPELRYTPNGTAIFEGTLAGEDQVIKQDGNTTNIPWYHRFSLMGKAAEYAASANYVAGNIMRVSGQVDYSEWEDSESHKKRSMIRVKVNPMGLQRLEDRPEHLVNDSGGGVRLAALGGSFNQVSVSGNLTRDAELRHTAGGDPVITLRLAINESWMDRNNQRQNKTHYLDIELWREQAKAVSDYKKGQGVFALGRLQNKAFTSKEGDKRNTTELSPSICEAIITPPRSDAAGAAPARQAAAPARQTAAPARQAAPARSAPPSRPAPSRSGGLDIDQGLDDFPPDEDLPF